MTFNTSTESQKTHFYETPKSDPAWDNGEAFPSDILTDEELIDGYTVLVKEATAINDYPAIQTLFEGREHLKQPVWNQLTSEEQSAIKSLEEQSVFGT